MLPLVAAFTGWLLNLLATRLMINALLKRRRLMAAELASIITEKIISFQQIEQQITDPRNIEKVLPEVEAHIDHFLRVKLSSTMPMISMFIGDKTISQLKEVFMAELKELFPTLLRNYVLTLQNDFNLEQAITDKMSRMDAAELETTLRKLLAPQLRIFQLTGAVTGFIIGLVQLLLYAIA